jgi:transcriptional regulator with XRE-family HTH domain
MSLAKRLRQARETAAMTQDELAAAAGVSKTYIWELEKDEAGDKKPSAEILLRIADALSVTLADLLGLPTVKVKERKVALTKSFIEFRDRMDKLKTPLSAEDIEELAGMSFRGGRPRTADDWHALYLTLERLAPKKKHGDKAT